MLTLDDIAAQFPLHLQAFRYAMLREYLQYKILDVIFAHDASRKLIFIGGTALRIVHGISRFSEDLDFDNAHITESEFRSIGETIHAMFQKENVRSEVDMVGKLAMRLRIRIPGLLYAEGISPMPDEKILIQVDTLMQGVDYKRETFVLQKFDILRAIAVAPPDVLLAQKLYAILNRKSLQARDLYDATFLLGKTAPNEKYLKEKGFASAGVAYRKVLEKIRGIDLAPAGKSLAPFLFDANDVRKIALFPALLEKMLHEWDV